MNPQPAHFVQEAVQNADDNDYVVHTPLLKITYLNDTILITTNEIGFSNKNVQAICTINESTKKHRPDCTEEKGIGFKSFFKIAVAIHISSRGFSFKFDSRRLCGMIDPEWVEFPKHHEQPGTTQFLLQLAPDAPKARIKSDLQAFDPIQLLFIRRLRTAEVSVDGEVVTVIREDFEEFQGYNGEVRRITVSKPGSQTQIVTNYMIVSNKIKVTHGSSKRVGIQETEVALGFPFTSDSPVIHPQNAHNFLPIRKTSFFVSIAVVGSSNTKNLLTSHSFSSMLTSSWLPIGKIWMTCMRNGITCLSELWLRPSPWQLSASRILRSSTPGFISYQLPTSRALPFQCFHG
jgi:hypothetical protein